MSYIDKVFKRREKKIRRNYEIEDSLYSRLDELTHIYDASINDLINASLEHLITSENMEVYKKDDSLSVSHTLLIRESNIAGLEKLKDKYGISIYKLVNIAIRNVLEEL